MIGNKRDAVTVLKTLAKDIGVLVGGVVVLYAMYYVLVHGFISDLVSFLVLHLK